MAIVNGRRIQVPPAGITGQNLIQQMNPGPGRRPVIRQGLAFRSVQPGYTYKPEELFDRHGNPVKITTIPDRTKGMVTYGGDRTFLSKQIITEQVYDIAEKLFKKGVSFDEEHADWMIADQYVLPPLWHNIARTTDLLIIFPTEYPELPPVGFYLKGNSPSCGAGGAETSDSNPLLQRWHPRHPCRVSVGSVLAFSETPVSPTHGLDEFDGCDVTEVHRRCMQAG